MKTRKIATTQAIELLEKLGNRLLSTTNSTNSTATTINKYEALAEVYKVLSLLKETEKAKYIHPKRESNAS